MNDATKQNSTFWKWQNILALVYFFVGSTSLWLGLALYLFGTPALFHIHEQQEQSEVLAKINEHFAKASTSHSINVAEQQLTEAIAEIERYVKAEPLAEISGSDFENWYKGMLAIKQQLSWAEQVKSSNDPPSKKLQAEIGALESLKTFAEIKLTNVFGANLGVEYNVPSSIPLRMNALETKVAACYWLLFPVAILGISLATILIFGDDFK